MIKLKNLLKESNSDIIHQIEQELLRFDLVQDKYHAEERRKPGYKRELNRLLPIVKKLGIEKTKELNKAAQGYTATLYGRMNKSLRADKLPPKAALIDQYIEAAPKFSGSELYRGIGRELFQTILSAKSKNFIDKAFMSTTEDYTTAETFARRTGRGGVLILTGALNKAAQAPLPLMMSEGEAEFIFPRNTRIEITKIDGDEIHATVL
jgi:hypothetical protein